MSRKISNLLKVFLHLLYAPVQLVQLVPCYIGSAYEKLFECIHSVSNKDTYFAGCGGRESSLIIDF